MHVWFDSMLREKIVFKILQKEITAAGQFRQRGNMIVKLDEVMINDDKPTKGFGGGSTLSIVAHST